MSSETAAERCFCHLRNVFGTFRKKLGDDLVTSLIRIRMDDVFGDEAENCFAKISEIIIGDEI